MAGKFHKAEIVVRNVFLALVAFFWLDGAAIAELDSNGRSNYRDNIFLLESRCGYILGENISSKTVDSSMSVNNGIVSFDFYLVMKLDGSAIRGKLSFSCFVAGSSVSSSSVANKTTAVDEIALEDSGGRYVRNIVWQRKYEGKGWDGTVAYVNSVYGDRERMRVPDYFLICPNAIYFPCFSFEVVGRGLAKKESDRIPVVLGGIEVVALRSTVPETNERDR
ncbi:MULTISPECIES: hypothetical protein [Burkholderia]|uniref:hypothetical protein n=2 Tax=Burkholderiaceae TaxID=119060 RepID=UPI00158F3CD6|nr:MULTISPECIES: hypothetical protein [unclassified Burkholderia]CAG2336602.1 hypothetical protein BCCR75389_04893 [Burkholderia cenocepacia]QVN14863.1 hypothetical protein JYG37_22480 [Burkholderia sp. LAS2]CAG2336811.1 hypothetical protein BCCR75388_04918 [Burkholderia cenocepacia]CAG2336829.1 hypothetical protein BCCR75384_04917 [Burkholderia cenocepacia]CAG2336894.1 hypothetical protein BCCR12632_04920 [Burkholderia cenocepacia]